MSEILTIRLNSDPQESIPWLVWSPSRQEVIASGEAESLIMLTEYAREREVLVLADSSSLTLTKVTIPSGSERQLETVLPFLLEDDIAQDVTHVHVSLLSKEGDLAYVALLEHRVMQAWISSLSEAGMTVRRIIPDCLCLPFIENTFTAAMLNNRWLLRSDIAQGGSADETWLPMLLRALNSGAESSENPHPVLSYSGLPTDAGDNWRSEPTELVMLLLAQGAMKNTYNLMTGRYKSQNQFYKYLYPWRNAAIAFSLLFTFLGAWQVVDIFQVESLAVEYRTQSEKQVRTLMPHINRIPTTTYMKKVFEDEFKRLSGSGDKTGLLVWLENIAPILSNASSIHLDAIRFDLERGELRLSASGKDFGEFEKLREAFSTKYKTELGQLNRDNEMIAGAFVLKKEP